METKSNYSKRWYEAIFIYDYRKGWTWKFQKDLGQGQPIKVPDGSEIDYSEEAMYDIYDLFSDIGLFLTDCIIQLG